MDITFINVGYGEAALVTQGGFVALIDGGSGEEGEYAGPRIRCRDYLIAKGVDHIDLMVNTHIHEDHIAGLAQVADALPVGMFWTHALPRLPDRDLDTALERDAGIGKFACALNAHRRLVKGLTDKGVPVLAVGEGVTAQFAGGLAIQALGPQAGPARALAAAIEGIWASPDPAPLIAQWDGRMNNLSLVLRLTWAGQRALLVGDANAQGLKRLLDQPDALAAQVYKIGHHGQIDGVDRALLDAIAPKYVLFSASSDRRYDSAHPSVVALAQRAGATPLFTDPPGGSHQGVTFSFNLDGVCYRHETV